MGEETDVVEPMSSDDVAAGDETADEPSKEQHRKRKKLLYKSIRELMEFYLGDINLSKNRFIFQHIQGQPFVYMDLSVFLTFNKIKALTSRVEDLAKSIAGSEILQVSEDGMRVCRKTPLKRKENEDDCTIYVEQLPPEVDQVQLIKVFSEFGQVDYVSMPKYAHSNKFKGFAFLEFKNPESANKAIEVLSSKGCCLSRRMAPGELMSIKHFDPNKENSKTNYRNMQNKKIKFEDKPERSDTEDNPESESMDENSKDTKSNNKESKKSKKTKRKLSNEANSVELETNNSEETDKFRKGNKVTPSEKENEASTTQDSDKSTRTNQKRKHSSEEINECETSEPAEKKIKSDVETEQDTEESNTEVEGEKEVKEKKKRKRKKVKKDKATAVSLGLKVLPKREWKRLRNKYLNMQKDTMRSLKQQLSYSKWEKNKMAGGDLEEKQGGGKPTKKEGQAKMVPGTVVKIILDEPVTNVKASKIDMRVHPEIRYVDITEGSNVAYLRTPTTEMAESLIQSKHWPTMEIITGDEESEYWDKVKQDREEYFNKTKPNNRGRTKLLKKAERIQAANTFEASQS